MENKQLQFFGDKLFHHETSKVRYSILGYLEERFGSDKFKNVEKHVLEHLALLAMPRTIKGGKQTREAGGFLTMAYATKRGEQSATSSSCPEDCIDNMAGVQTSSVHPKVDKRNPSVMVVGSTETECTDSTNIAYKAALKSLSQIKSGSNDRYFTVVKSFL